MAHFFAAVASNILHWFLLLNIIILVLFVFLLRLVLRVLAARLVSGFFTTAPPNLTTELTPVHTATPVEVLLLDVVLAAVLAHFLCDVEFTLLLLELFDTVLHFLPLSNQVLPFFLEGYFGFKGFICLVSLLF